MFNYDLVNFYWNKLFFLLLFNFCWMIFENWVICVHRQFVVYVLHHFNIWLYNILRRKEAGDRVVHSRGERISKLICTVVILKSHDTNKITWNYNKTWKLKSSALARANINQLFIPYLLNKNIAIISPCSVQATILTNESNCSSLSYWDFCTMYFYTRKIPYYKDVLYFTANNLVWGASAQGLTKSNTSFHTIHTILILLSVRLDCSSTQ